MAQRAIWIAMLSVLLWGTGSAGEAGDDAWQGLRPLVGEWRGEGSGFGNVSDVTHTWEFAIQERFLRLRTSSTIRGKEGPGAVHEDVGYLSRDSDRSAFVFRQFLSEGFVNVFDVSFANGEGATILFGERASESAGGMRAQMRLEFISDTEYEMVLDLAMPGKEFAACQWMRMKKARESGD